jgi:hypothetical protein
MKPSTANGVESGWGEWRAVWERRAYWRDRAVKAEADLGAVAKALKAYHDLVPALAECANECGEARLYSDLKQANDRARAALDEVARP